MTPPPAEETVKKRSQDDYVFGKVIGEGSFSTVYLAKDIHTNKEFAIKVLEKRHIIKENKMEYVMREKKVLQILGNSTYFVRLYCTFQDGERLYFVLTYAKNGDFLTFLNKTSSLMLDCVRHYAAEIVLALETLNTKGIVHRDLKPENILLDENWHILITDFGSAKILIPVEGEKNESDEEGSQKRRNSFVGTAQYVSPEILTDGKVSFASDLWAFGCILYQMVVGLPPFRAGSEYLIFQKILKLEYEFPTDIDTTIQDLIKNLLILTPEKRLGANESKIYTSIRQHPFFRDTNWNNLGPAPKILPSEASALGQSQAAIPENLQPGLDEKKESMLHAEIFGSPMATPTRKKSQTKNIADLSEEEIRRRLETQKTDRWHNLVEGNLILKQGLVDKRKGLFPRRRMFLLTLGPHLYYVDPTTMILKGEIPWSPDIKTEAKNFKTFLVHTPNRTYYLEDPDGYALEWCKAIEELKVHYFPESKT
ncbi:3-phosphoinositide-dependent protein kinase 1 [Agrilus planipennis]|uniref:3-phosphoinositide-dependent protein kinase 1 n=1 Tax=Agrilus planipennis TaxID=224129 RepID=A0A1W4XM00_AGRPL|nr:3-phosphoinositide-dependent protein kinase 1 [Agrilus planipennis]